MTCIEKRIFYTGEKMEEQIDEIDEIKQALSKILETEVEGFILSVDTKSEIKTLINAKPLAQHYLLSYLNAEVVELELKRKKDARSVLNESDGD